MRNFVLLLVLVCGLASGYFIGDWRGKDARKALEMAIETGKTLEREREAAIVALKKDLDDINAKYRRDMEANRKDYETRSIAWDRTKAELDKTIKRQTEKLAESNRNIDDLTAKLGGSVGAEKERLKQEIARLRKQNAELQREAEGNRCLKTQVPRSVLDALGGAIERGSK